MSREIYIGNGEIITVQMDEFKRKEYDWVKLQNYLDEGKFVIIGIKEDWFFTAKCLEQSDIDNKNVLGVVSSDWGTPSVLLDYKYIDCYKFTCKMI